VKKICTVAACALLAVGSANASITESEPNDSIGTADVITRGASPWADTGVMSFGAGGGDLDFFAIDLLDDEVLTVITTPLDPKFDSPDTMLGIFDAGGTLLDFNDDANGLGSALRFSVPSAGTYYIGVTGFPDFDFLGDHDQTGRYQLTVAIVPAPAGMAMLGAAGLIARRRRRG